MNYYNEIDPNAAAWLEELITRKQIPAGEVDQRSITDVSPTDLSGYAQCHFFAGIGGWPLALRIAGVPDNCAADTGSCPCPPFSSAGKKKLCPECGGKPIPHPLKTGIFACVPCGYEWFADERHLYPELYRIISKRRPPVFFGEQVVGTDGLIWLAGVRATLEKLGRSFGAADLCSAGVASPNIRQRLYYASERLADSEDADRWSEQQKGSTRSGRDGFAGGGQVSGMGDAGCQGSQGHDWNGNDGNQPGWIDAKSTGSIGETSGTFDRLGDPDGVRSFTRRETTAPAGHGYSAEPTDFWSDSYPILCRDGNTAGFQLNPRFSLWLMGFPTSWHDAGAFALRSLKERETQSIPTSPRSSSKRISKRKESFKP